MSITIKPEGNKIVLKEGYNKLFLKEERSYIKMSYLVMIRDIEKILMITIEDLSYYDDILGCFLIDK